MNILISLTEKALVVQLMHMDFDRRGNLIFYTDALTGETAQQNVWKVKPKDGFD